MNICVKRICLGMLLGLLLLSPVFGQIRPGVQINLEKMLERQTKVQVDGGYGLLFIFTRSSNGMQDEVAVSAGNRRIAHLEGGKFIELRSLEFGPAKYWILSEFSGGAHCCGQYNFFAQAGPQSLPRYLGVSNGHNGGPLPLGRALLVHQGQLYFRDLDNRFDYFHESHAGSMLVNLPENFLKLTPAGITVDNLPFKAHFLRMAEQTEGEIRKEAAARRQRPPALLRPGFGPGFSNMIFTDALGQLLVKRTLYLLYAREDQRAWESFARDAARYYQSAGFVPELKAEILEILSKGTY